MDLKKISCEIMFEYKHLGIYLFSKNSRAFYYQIFREQVGGYILEIGGVEGMQNLTNHVLKCFFPLM